MIKTTIALLICIVFIFSDVAKTYLGPVYSYVQIITLLGGVMICLKTLLSRCEKSIMIILLGSLILLFVIPLFSSLGYINTLSSLSFLYSIILGYILFCRKKLVVKILFVFLIANFFALLGETFLGLTFVDKSENYQSGYNVLYKFGLFSDPKSGGFFILITGLLAYLHGNFILLIVAFTASIFTGVRISTVALLLPLIDLFMIGIKRYNIKKIVVFSICICSIAYYYLYTFFQENSVVMSRLLTAVSSQDGSNQLRFFYWIRHWEEFINSSFAHIFWGNYGYADAVVGNGAECAFLDLLNNYGIFSFLIYSITLFYIWLRYFLDRRVFLFCLGIFAASVSGRFILGFSAGPIVWMIFFSFIVKHYSDIFNPLVGKYNFRCQATCIEI